MVKILIYAVLSVVLIAGCSRQANDEIGQSSPKGPMAYSLAETTRVINVASFTGKTNLTPATDSQKTNSRSVPCTDVVLSEIDKSLHTITKDSAELSTDELKNYVNAYEQLILVKQNELQGLKEHLRGLSISEIIGDRGRELKQQVEDCSAQVTELQKRYQIYQKALKEWE